MRLAVVSPFTAERVLEWSAPLQLQYSIPSVGVNVGVPGVWHEHLDISSFSTRTRHITIHHAYRLLSNSTDSCNAIPCPPQKPHTQQVVKPYKCFQSQRRGGKENREREELRRAV